MDFNKAFFLKNEARKPKWRVIDAKGKILGRLATEIADILRGKDKPGYTPHTDSGDYVVIINATQVCLSGNKMDQKVYASYSGYMGGYKERTVGQMMERDPRFVIEHAVSGMLPKNKLNRCVLKKLKVYPGVKHPHAAQVG